MLLLKLSLCATEISQKKTWFTTEKVHTGSRYPKAYVEKPKTSQSELSDKKPGFQTTFLVCAPARTKWKHAEYRPAKHSTPNTLAALQSLSELTQLKQILIYITDLHFKSRGDRFSGPCSESTECPGW